MDGLNTGIGIAAAAASNPDEFLLQSFRAHATVKTEDKHSRKKWMVVAAVSVCAILVLTILAMRLFIPGTTSAKKSSQRTASEAQTSSNIPKPSPSTPMVQGQAPPATPTPATVDTQGAEQAEDSTPPEVQSQAMNDQLNAPTRIPRDIGKSAAENEPPPAAGFGTGGTESLGGGNPVDSVFKGKAQPAVHAAVSNPVTISAGVAVGLLIQKIQPIYPPIAKAARVSGTVDIQATISTTGTLKDMHVVSGPVMLRQAALDAVRNWRYKPYKLNNEPLEVQTTIHVIFTLGA